MNEPLLEWLDRKAEALADSPEELERLRSDLQKVVRVAPVDHEAAAVRVRGLVEQIVRQVHRTRLGDPKSKPLFNMIESLREKGGLPPRIVSYLHTIRRIGDDGAHGFAITREDLYAVILPLLLVIEWYFCSFEEGPRTESIYRPEVIVESAPAVPGADAALNHADIIEELLALAEAHPDDFRVDLWIEKDKPGTPQRDFAPDPADAAPRFHLEERAVICARAERDCRLWIVDVGTTGNTALVFPRTGDGDNRVKAGEVVRIPGKVTGKAGLETVHAFASTAEFPLGRVSSLTAAAVRDFLADEREVRQSGHSAAATLQFGINDQVD